MNKASKKAHSAELTKQHIIRTAVQLFSRKGYSDTTTREIAAAANVSHTLLHKYFTSKEGLYLACIQSKTQMEDFGSDPFFDTDQPIEKLREFLMCQLFPDEDTPVSMRHFRESLLLLCDHPLSGTQVWENERKEDLERRLAALIILGQQEGEIRNMDPHAMVRVILQFLIGEILLQSFNPDFVTPNNIELFIEMLRP
ncbi:MAG: TetR/AcrR family transcriptional regulator [Blautia sp.]|nr:TetR/AcrR family transcriptional regulator [Blautia sp.]